MCVGRGGAAASACNSLHSCLLWDSCLGEKALAAQTAGDGRSGGRDRQGGALWAAACGAGAV